MDVVLAATRMLLHPPGRGGMISKPKLVARFEMFVRSEWQALIKAGEGRVYKAATGQDPPETH